MDKFIIDTSIEPTGVRMGIGSQIKNGGWGAIVLYIYSLLVFLYWDVPLVTSDRIVLVVAALPALCLMFTVFVLNHKLNDYWAGGNLKRSTETIDRITGEHDFYHSASEETQAAVDEFDEKAYTHHISILTGIIIAATVPIIGYFAIGLTGIAIGILFSIISFRALTIHSYREVNQLATDLSKPYEEKYENQ